MISCSSKDIHFKDMCCKREQGLHVQNMIASLDSRVNLIVEEGGGEGAHLYEHLMCMRNSTLTMNKLFIRAPKTMRKVATPSIRIR